MSLEALAGHIPTKKTWALTGAGLMAAATIATGYFPDFPITPTSTPTKTSRQPLPDLLILPDTNIIPIEELQGIVPKIQSLELRSAPNSTMPTGILSKIEFLNEGDINNGILRMTFDPSKPLNTEHIMEAAYTKGALHFQARIYLNPDEFGDYAINVHLIKGRGITEEISIPMVINRNRPDPINLVLVWKDWIPEYIEDNGVKETLTEQTPEIPTIPPEYRKEPA